MAATATAPKVSSFSVPQPIEGNYFIAVYPPFSAWQPAHVPALETALSKTCPPRPVGLYVHLPFCQKKCDYCYYLSYIGKTAEAVDRYIGTLELELNLYAKRPALRGRPISFIYFGGGTPSMLTSCQARRLGNGLHSALPWDNVEEVTFECAPRSVRRDLLENLRKIGVTRLSMGVQSFDNMVLKRNGRIHLSEDVRRAFALIQEAGFDWVNLDLMVGLMGETRESWRYSIRQIIDLGPESVTLYQTEIPCNTQLYWDWRGGGLPSAPVPWEIKRMRLAYGFNELERAGYTVVSGYAAVKDPIRHRFLYQHDLWHGGDMLGLGVGSFGYFDGVHYQNEVTIEKYKDKVGRQFLPIKRALSLSDRDRLVREFILQFKRGQVATRPFQTRFGADITRVFARPLEELAAEGLLTVSSEGVRLTRAGLLQVDRLLPRFYDPQYRDVRYT